MGYKVYSDSYLMSLTKAEIIELLRVAEHNFFAMEEALNNSAKAGMEIAEKYDKAKELLKLAVEDFAESLGAAYTCPYCKYERKKRETCAERETQYCKGICKWRYSDKALKLIEEKINKNNTCSSCEYYSSDGRTGWCEQYINPIDENDSCCLYEVRKNE